MTVLSFHVSLRCFGLPWCAVLKFGTSAVGAVLVMAIIAAAHLVQVASLNRLRGGLEALPWFPSQEAYGVRLLDHLEAIKRSTIDPSKRSAEKLEAAIEAEGQKLSRPLDRLGSGPRPIYSAAALCRSQY